MGLAQSKDLNIYEIIQKMEEKSWGGAEVNIWNTRYLKEISRKIMGLARSKGLNMYHIIQEKEEKL